MYKARVEELKKSLNSEVSSNAKQWCLLKLSYTFDEAGSNWQNTYVDPHGKSHRYDYVLSSFGGRSEIIDEPYVLQYSDHCAVYYEVS